MSKYLLQNASTADELPSSEPTLDRTFLNLSFYHQQLSPETLLGKTLHFNHQHIEILQQYLDDLNYTHTKHDPTIQMATACLKHIQSDVGNTLKDIKYFRNNIKQLKNNLLVKQKIMRNIHIKQLNLLMIKQQLTNINQIKNKILNMQSYQQLINMLNKKQYIPYHSFQQLCLNRITTLINRRVNSYQQSDYIWKYNHLHILKVVIKAIINIKCFNYENKQPLNNLTDLFRRYAQIANHINFQKGYQQQWINQFNKIWMEKLRDIRLHKSYQQLIEGKSIMQNNKMSRVFMDQLINNLNKQKQYHFNQIITNIQHAQNILEQDLRISIKIFQQQYQWLSVNGIKGQYQQIRALITRKIIYPLMIDIPSKINKIKKVHKYHILRIWNNYKPLFNYIKPIVKNNEYNLLSINQYHQSQQSNGVLGYMKYTFILIMFWSEHQFYPLLQELWVKLLAEYIYRKQPNQINKIKNIHFLKQKIIQYYNNLVKQIEKEEQLIKKYYYQNSPIYQSQHDIIYHYVIKNKFSKYNFQTIDILARKINSLKQLQNLRQNAYQSFQSEFLIDK